MSKKKVKFPETLFVTKNAEEGYFLADVDADSFDDGDRVAIYELVQIKTVERKTTLVGGR